jgi:hypothetical protein
MKKLMLFAVAVFGFTANAQNFNIGISGGLPIGDTVDAYTFAVQLDVNYLWEVSEKFDAGVASGFSQWFGDAIDLGVFGSFDVEDASLLPVAAAGRFNASEDFTIGADLGYAIGISPDGNDGGFYYAPKVQYSVSESIDVVAAYRGVSVDGGSLDMITLGVEFGF